MPGIGLLLAVGTLGTAAVPVLTALDPPGITRGTTGRWTLTGRNLGDFERVLISGTGVEVLGSRSSDLTVALTVRADDSAEPGFRELRVEGTGGVSNLLLVRVDDRPQFLESEPNDDPAHATPIPTGTVASGILRAQDLDCYRFEGRAGQPVTVEVEARRLGTPLNPVVTLVGPGGFPGAQGRATRGLGHDCRWTCLLPADGTYTLQVRDNLYGGGATAVYRLRVGDVPFATALFPLGGPPGRTIAVTASGGNLKEPRSLRVALPDEPGAIVDVGPYSGPGGAVLAPMRLVVGDGPESDEPPGQPTTPLRIGTTVNGRIAAPGEVDRYAVRVVAGESFRIKVRGSALGSWLDPVVTLSDARGNPIAENDDGAIPVAPGVPDASPLDSLIEHTAATDGDLSIAITDRAGEGGPEYAYRLSVLPDRPDFSIRLTVGSSGAFRLEPGRDLTIPCEVAVEGRPVPVRVRALGLPPGVRAEPLTLRPRPSGADGGGGARGVLVLKATPEAAPGVGWLRVVASARRGDGSVVMRTAAAVLPVATIPATFPDRGTVRVVTSFPVKVVGKPRPSQNLPQKPGRRAEEIGDAFE